MEWRLALPQIAGASMLAEGKHGEITFSASAFDVPRYMDFKLDTTTHRLRIDFRYPDAEESTAKPVDRGIEVLVGIMSGKLLGFVVKDVSEAPGQIAFGLQRAVDSQLATAKQVNHQLNYRTIQQVMRDGEVGRKLEEVLAAA